jgi:hypothetical protein
MPWGRRRSVVIGNAQYCGTEAPFFYELSSQGRDDAIAVTEAFTECEFETKMFTDAGDSELDAALRGLAEETVAGDVAIVFFGGHGIEHNGERYIMGVRSDRQIEDGAAPTAGVSVSEVTIHL